MSRNLLQKAIAIAIVVLACIYGLIGRPTLPTSATAVRENLRNRLRLGLDLQGGTHLVLQVRVNEAVNAEADQSIERLRTTL